MSETQQVQYVGFWARVLAAFVDTIAVGILLGILVRILGLHAGLYYDHGVPVFEPGAVGHIGAQQLLYAAIVVGFWSWKMATPGKMVIGAVIVDAQTLGKPSTGQLIGRYLGYFVSTIPFFLGLIWVAFDARKQGWHDKLADTVVIKARG